MIQLLRNNFRSGGAIRLDHVMAFCRLFWIPRGRPASEGTYVQYPFEDLLAIVALESIRSKTLVIGEDLGTVPDWVREQLAKARVLSYRVFYFERGADGAMKSPGDYPAQSLAVATTHDLPTLTGFWSGEDLHVRSGLGVLPDDTARRQAWEERRRDKGSILSALQREHLLPPGVTEDLATAPVMTTELCHAIHLYLARTPSCIVLANLEDGLGELSQTNLPGTVDSHPNWTRKYPIRVEEMLCDERLRQLGAVLRSTRPLGVIPFIRMLKKSASFVLGSSKSSTYPCGYASGFDSPAALLEAVLFEHPVGCFLLLDVQVSESLLWQNSSFSAC